MWVKKFFVVDHVVDCVVDHVIEVTMANGKKRYEVFVLFE